MFAAMNGHVNIVRSLIEDYHANPMLRTPDGNFTITVAGCCYLREQGWDALSVAANSGHRGLVEYLIQRGGLDHTDSWEMSWHPVLSAILVITSPSCTDEHTH